MKQFLVFLLFPLFLFSQDYCDLDFNFNSETVNPVATFAIPADNFQNNDQIGVFYNSSTGLECVGSATYIAGGLSTIYVEVFSTDENTLTTLDELIFIVQSASTIRFIETVDSYYYEAPYYFPIDANYITIGSMIYDLPDVSLGVDIVECELNSIELTNINDDDGELIIYNSYQWLQAEISYNEEEVQIPGEWLFISEIDGGTSSTITVSETAYYALIVSNESGCTSYDQIFINFIDDEECNTPGCTYADACNYDPNATENDGSCQYPEDLYPPATEGLTDYFLSH